MAYIREHQKNILFILLLAIVFTSKGGQAAGPAHVGKVGEACDRNQLCLDNANCEGGVCTCAEDYVPSSDNRACFKVTTDWEGPCSETIQCQKFIDATCSGGKCECHSYHHFLDGQCWTTRNLKEECNNDNECLLREHQDRVECSNKVCNCKEEFIINDTGDDCNGGNSLWSPGLISLLLLHSIKLIFF